MNKEEDTTKTEKQEPGGNYFLTLLASLGAIRGQLCDELSEQLRLCQEAAEQFHEPAELTLKLKVKPKTGVTVVNSSFSTKIPRPNFDNSFYVGEDGHLQKKNPNQRDLPFDDLGDDEPVAISITSN